MTSKKLNHENRGTKNKKLKTKMKITEFQSMIFEKTVKLMLSGLARHRSAIQMSDKLIKLQKNLNKKR